MSGLGHLLLDLGFSVAGSDLDCGDEVRQLQERGAKIFPSHEARQLLEIQPVLVVYSSAIRRDNPELQAAESNQISSAMWSRFAGRIGPSANRRLRGRNAWQNNYDRSVNACFEPVEPEAELRGGRSGASTHADRKS